jgi:surface polysaccharide O-acyltransferase-like enzyme
VRSATERDFRYFVAVCILGTWGYKILSTFFDLKIGLYFELFTNQTGFFVLGYYLGCKTLASEAATVSTSGISPWRLSRSQLFAVAFGLIAVGTVSTALGTYLCSTTIGGGKFHPFFYDYLTPNVSMSAMGWFLLVKWFFNKTPLRSVEKDFAAASFGIYFIHVLMMDWLAQAGYWQTKFHPALCIPVLIVLIAGLGFMFVLIIRALPGGTKIT